MNFGSMLDWDRRLSVRLQLKSRGPLRASAIFFAHSGDSWFWFIGLALTLLLGSQAWKTLALIMTGAIITTALFVLFLKFTINRPRPEGTWGGIYRKTDPHSFPSGHAARAFLLMVIGIGAAPPWFAIVVAVWAPLVALARVSMGVHYLSDIAAGALIGVLMGMATLFASTQFGLV